MGHRPLRRESDVFRQIADHDVRIEQLERRFVPEEALEGGAADGHLAMAYINFAGQAVTDGGWIGVSYDSPVIDIDEGYTNPAAEVTLAGAAQQQLRVDTLTDGGGTKYGIYVTSGSAAADPERHGVYAITGACEWDGDDFDGHVGLMLNMASMLPMTFAPNVLTDANLFALAGTNFSQRFQEISIETIVTGPSNGTFIGLDVFQDSGGDYDLVDASLIVQQIGWFSASEGTFITP